MELLSKERMKRASEFATFYTGNKRLTERKEKILLSPIHKKYIMHGMGQKNSTSIINYFDEASIGREPLDLFSTHST